MESSANNPGITSLPVTDEKLDFKEMVVLYYVYHGFKPESIQILLSGKLRVRAGLPRTNDKDFDKYNAAFQQEIQDRTWQKFRDQNWAQTVTTMGQYLAQGQTDYEFADNLRLSKEVSWISHVSINQLAQGPAHSNNHDRLRKWTRSTMRTGGTASSWKLRWPECRRTDVLKGMCR